MHPSEAKRKLRQDIKDRIERMSDQQRHAEGRTLSRVLLEHLPSPVTVAAYFPLKTEVDIRLLLTTLIERGDTVFLPCYEEATLVFRQAESLGHLPRGELSIPEPPKTAPQLSENEHVDVFLVPGRAFDRTGNRLGRGSGGYDRWIEQYRAHHPETQFWGVGLECQLVNEVPVEKHDMRMDAVVTARGKIETTENGEEARSQ